jgi:hypothetical protein
MRIVNRERLSRQNIVATLRLRIKKLERLVWDAIYALQKAGLDSEAARLDVCSRSHEEAYPEPIPLGWFVMHLCLNEGFSL